MTKETKNSAENDVAIASSEADAEKKKPRRVIRRRNKNKKKNDAVKIDPVLLEKTMKESNLPSAYSFEIEKTVQRILQLQARHIALQMPEGLLLYATVISDVLKRLVAASSVASSDDDKTPSNAQKQRSALQVSILGDVTYGACCVDDLGAKALGCQLLVHYGHSCLVPINHTAIPCLYVFVEITIDVPHLVECVDLTLSQQQSNEKPHVYLLGTIQFRHALTEARKLLEAQGYTSSIPQAKPLSPGEVLGCTSPVLTGSGDNNTTNTVVVFVADGRFHLESTLISNPHIPLFLRYDPYSKTLTEESYEHTQMKNLRYQAIQQGKTAVIFGIILGTLGRQGNPALLTRIQQLLQKHHKRSFVMLASEITPQKLALFQDKVDAWVQIACPRLSVDWGHFLSQKPVLNPYELHVCLGEAEFDVDSKEYPMDYYAKEGGPWSNYHADNTHRELRVTAAASESS